MASGGASSQVLPTGTVTLLFADVEGSTRLVHALGERYPGVRRRMQELVREVAPKWHGYEVDWAGDGPFLAFSSAREALAAAAAIQRALGAEPWPEDGVLRVRIGVHTGEPEQADGGYVGLDVHVAARICSAGHGSQVLVSQATHDLAGDQPAAGLSYRPLGRHRLKDVAEPQQLFQLVGEGLVADFPPLRTLAGATLPALHHRLVGRTADLTAVQALLTRPEVRLVSITGPGGAGKSRLALEVAGAAAVHRPVHLVGLAPISDSELVPAAIARALGIREAPGRTLVESIGESLRETGALVLLDNLEHLPDAAEQVRRLLDAVPDVKLLVTSRVPLRLAAEHVVPLAPLPVEDASTLFAELAAARGVVLLDDTLESVREICRRLDGLPLAIELVAARLVVLPPAQVLEALGEGLALDMEGPVDLPERQRTLRATIEWSYALLNERQRTLHESLAVFAGGCSLTDTRALVDPGPQFLPDLEALVAWSLLRSDVADGEVRLSMLETVREHAVARLEAEGKLDELRGRHAERFLALATTAQVELEGRSHAAWVERLEHELDNVRAALDWFVSSGRAEDALRMTSALARFWLAHAHVSEARRWLSVALALGDGGVSADTRAAALWTAAQLATAQSDWEGAVPLFEEARGLYRESGRHRDESLALSYLSFVALRRDDLGAAASFSDDALRIAREIDDARAESAALMALADVRSAEGDHRTALELYEGAVELRRSLGDPVLVSDAIYNLGLIAFYGDDYTRARTVFEESLGIARSLDETPYIAAAQFMLAELDLLAGDAGGGARARESLAIYSELEDDRSRARCLALLAGAAALEGSFEEAARLVGASEALRGGAPPDLFESPILERYEEQIRTALGEAGFSKLVAEGSRSETDVSAREVVSSGIEE
jgi:predicted ATPase/class 3 adenylate cyclase